MHFSRQRLTQARKVGAGVSEVSHPQAKLTANELRAIRDTYRAKTREIQA